jgi:hypothetical protein
VPVLLAGVAPNLTSDESGCLSDSRKLSYLRGVALATLWPRRGRHASSGRLLVASVVGYSAQQEPCRAEDAPLIKPEEMPAWLWIFLASLPNRDSRSSVKLAQAAGRRFVHCRTQPAEIVRDPLWPGHRRRSPWILTSPALSRPRWKRQCCLERSDPIRSLSHKLESQHHRDTTLAHGGTLFTPAIRVWRISKGSRPLEAGQANDG